MGKAPKDPREIFPEIIEDYRGVFGENLISIILYGSATGVDYRPGKSDINFIIILSEGGIDRLDLALNMVSKWRKRFVAAPLFLTEHYVETSLDVFPIEYLNFQRHHVLVFGKDILKELSFSRAFVRLQCEREVKGKLLLLRESFLDSSGRGRDLKEIISQSLRAFMAIFEALLFLKGEEIPPQKRELIRSTCENFGLTRDLFLRLLDIKEGRQKPGDEEIKKTFHNYLAEVRQLSRLVDAMEGKGGSDE